MPEKKPKLIIFRMQRDLKNAIYNMEMMNLKCHEMRAWDPPIMQ